MNQIIWILFGIVVGASVGSYVTYLFVSKEIKKEMESFNQAWAKLRIEQNQLSKEKEMLKTIKVECEQVAEREIINNIIEAIESKK